MILSLPNPSATSADMITSITCLGIVLVGLAIYHMVKRRKDR